MTADGIVWPRITAGGGTVRMLHSDDDWARRSSSGPSSRRRRVPSRPNIGCSCSEGPKRCRVVAADGLAAFFGAFVDDRLRSMLGIYSDGREQPGTRAWRPTPTTDAEGWPPAWSPGPPSMRFPSSVPHRLVIVADSDGPAIGLYRRLGFRSVEFQVQLQRAVHPLAGGRPPVLDVD